MLADVTLDEFDALHRLVQELEQRLEREARLRHDSERACARLIAVIDRIPDLVAMAGPDGSLAYLNPAGKAMLNARTSADVVRFKLNGCFPGLSAPTPHADDELAAAARDGVWRGESCLVDAAGRSIPTSNVVIAHRDASGALEGFSTIVRDNSARVDADDACRRSTDELRRLSASHVSMQEDERKRIAGELHDGLGQALSLVKLTIEEAVRHLSAGAVADAEHMLRRLVPNIVDVLGEVRRISMALRPSTLDDIGILATLSWYFRELAAVRHGVTVHKVFQITEDQVPAALKLAIYRIVQEATHNMLKHAGASLLRVSLTHRDDTLQLCIEDDGCGFDPDLLHARGDDRRGLGLLSMRERALLSDGAFALRSTPGQGTSVQVTWSPRPGAEPPLRG